LLNAPYGDGGYENSTRVFGSKVGRRRSKPVFASTE
jgi:hypothetical protein